MKQVPMLQAKLSLHQFAEVAKVFPAHELPLFSAKWASNEFEIVGKTGDFHDVSDIDAEVARMVSIHGHERLARIYGGNYRDTIEMSIEKILDKEKEIDGSENTAQPKNRASAETRV
jgi:hypothetical protein